VDKIKKINKNLENIVGNEKVVEKEKKNVAFI
jgi:hypothetical protein